MDQTHNLKLSRIMPSQAQKHVTHNEALQALDAIVQLSVLDRHLTAPPTSPSDGSRFIVASSPTGAWAGQTGTIAAWQDGAWAFYSPGAGWVAWVTDEATLLAYDGTDWVSVAATQNVPMFGINATADATSRLVVAAEASLFDNVGNGHQHKINKATAGDTASILFQTGYTGRAEFGIMGDDKWRVKLSPDGAAWASVITADPTTGYVGIGSDAPTYRLHVEGSTTIAAGIKIRTNGVTSGGLGGGIVLHHTNASGVLPLAGDRIGYVLFGTTDGVLNRQGGGIEGRAEADYSSTSLPTYFTFATAPVGAVARGERLRITADGTTRPGADNAYSLGSASFRWASVWAANGTIQTSDARDKAVAGPLDFAGALVDALDPVLFRWMSGGNALVASTTETIEQDGEWVPKLVPVARPGARLHAGFLAQDLKAAMEAASVDFGAWGLEDKDDPDSRQWTRPDQLIAVLWAALKETRAEMAALRRP